MGGCCSADNTVDETNTERKPILSDDEDDDLIKKPKTDKKKKKTPKMNATGSDADEKTDYDTDDGLDSDSVKRSKSRRKKRGVSPHGGGGGHGNASKRSTIVSPRAKKVATATQRSINSILNEIEDVSMILFDEERPMIDEKLRALQKSIGEMDAIHDSKLEMMISPLEGIANVLKNESESDSNIFEILNGVNKHLNKLINLTYYMNGLNNTNASELPNASVGEIYSDVLGVIGGILGVYLGDTSEDAFNSIKKDINIILGLKEQEKEKEKEKEKENKENKENKESTTTNSEESDNNVQNRIVSDKFKFASNIYENLNETYHECKLWAVRSLRWKNYVQNWNKKNGRKMRDVIKDWQLSMKTESSLNLQFIQTIIDEINKNVRTNFIKDDLNWTKNASHDNNNNGGVHSTEPTQNIIILFNNLLYIYSRLRILFINLQYIYQAILNPWCKKNVMIKNFINDNISFIEKDESFLISKTLKLTQFNTYYVTVRASCTPLFPRLIEKYMLFLQSFMHEKDFSLKGKMFKTRKQKYSSRATQKVFFEGKSETDDNDNNNEDDKDNDNDNDNEDESDEVEEKLWPVMPIELMTLFDGKTELYLYHTQNNTNSKRYLIAESYFHRLSWPIEVCSIANETPKNGQGLFLTKCQITAGGEAAKKNGDSGDGGGGYFYGKNNDCYFVRSDDRHGFPVSVEYGNLSCDEWDELDNGMLKFENLTEREKTEERKLSVKEKEEYEWRVIPCFESNSFVLIPTKSKGTLFLTANDTTNAKTKGKEYPIISSNQPMKLYAAKVPPKK